MARKKILKDQDGKTIYPVTIPQAVVDPETKETLKERLETIDGNIVDAEDRLTSLEETLEGKQNALIPGNGIALDDSGHISAAIVPANNSITIDNVDGVKRIAAVTGEASDVTDATGVAFDPDGSGIYANVETVDGALRVLAQGYNFMGAATPATDPGTPDQKVFYIASEAGTYTNFEGIVLTDGEIVILKYDGTWSKESTEAASLEKVKEIGQQVIYDVTKNNPTAGPNNDGKFESLSALLSDENLSTLIPVVVRCGGMSIRFVQSSDNKYVQYRLMADDWSTDTDDWSISDENVYIDNPEFIEVHTDAKDKILYGIKTTGDFYFGAGVPEQVQNEIDSETERAEAAEAAKLDKEGLDPDALGTLHAVENVQYLLVKIDSENKIIEGITGDGKKVVYIPTYFNNAEIDYASIKQLELGLSAQNYIKSLLPNVDNNSNVTLLAHAYHDNFMGFFPFFKEELDDKYWALEQNGFEQFVTKIQGRRTQNVYQIALITDTHQGGAYTPLSYGFRSIALFNKLIPYVDLAMHGGDISGDYGTSKMRLYSYMQEVMELFDIAENKNLLITRGNHDYNKNPYEEVSPIDVDWDNGIYYTRNGTVFTPVTKQTYRGGELYINNPDYIPDSLFRFIQATNAPVDAVWGDGAYYYYDIESAKIRFVVRSNYPILDNGTMSLVEEWKWIAQTALDLSDKASPTDWSVIVLSHEEATSSPKFTNIANAFISGSSVSVEGVTVNYGTLNGGGIPLVHLHGHEHNAAGYSNMNGFLDIGFRAGLTPKENLGDTTTYNIYVLSVDLVNKTIIADNIRGESILYDYENNIAKIEIGQTIKMANSGLSSQAAATWTSSNENIATVSDIGIVRGIGSGTATITGVEGSKTVAYTVQVI